jgi:hypothetical protein
MFSRQEYGFGKARTNRTRQLDAQTLELYDRGVFRYLTPDMDREYALDMWAYQFTGHAAYRWHRTASGLRAYAGSIERTTGAIASTIKQAIPINERHTFDVRGVLQQDGTGRRALLNVGYAWQVADGHTVGARHTFAEYKADLDATLYYRYQHPRYGRVRAGVTFLDLYNDFLYTTLGVPAEDELLKREYGRKPFLLSVSVTTPARYRLRGELHASVQPLSEMRLTALNTPTFRFQQDEQLYFMAGMLEYRFPYVTVGAFYRRDRHRTRRVGMSATDGETVRSDYTATQTTGTAGAYVLADWWKLQVEAWGMLTSYRDRQTGDAFALSTVDGPIDYREPRRSAKLRVLYEPLRPGPGPRIGLEYLALQRPDLQDSARMTRQWTGEFITLGSSNYRLALLLGYNFGSGSVTLGVGFDTDNDDLPPGIPDSPGRFDNGFGRLAIDW